MKKILILLLAFVWTSVVLGQDDQQVAVLKPKVVAGAVSENDKLIVLSSMKKAFAKIEGYKAYNRTEQVLIDAESEFQRSSKVSDGQIKEVGEQTGAAYICTITLSQEGNEIVVNSDMIDIATREYTNSDFITIKDKTDRDDVLVQCENLAYSLFGVEKQSTKSVAKSKATKKSSDAETGVVINGIRWATRNVAAPGQFADKPEDPGMFYQWNTTIGWSATNPMINSNGDTQWTGFKSSSSIWSTDNNVCPTGWRIPTKTELQMLIDVGGTWTTTPTKGLIFGVGKNSLFLPAPGVRDSGGTLGGTGSSGYYWSSTQAHDSALAYRLFFDSYSADYWSSLPKDCLLSVRCVAE